jgi:small subunit ribosomal protein S13
MVRLAGVDLLPNKNIGVALTYIFGVGPTNSRRILQQAGVNPQHKVKDLTEAEVMQLRDALKDCKVEGDLRKEVTMDIKRLMDIGTYRGVRHRKGLPVRGQRTKTNARTKRGKRKTVGMGKRKEEKKEE